MATADAPLTPLVPPTPGLFDADAKSAAEQTREQKGRSQRLGTILVLMVVLLYVGSGVMIQVLFDEMRS